MPGDGEEFARKGVTRFAERVIFFERAVRSVRVRNGLPRPEQRRRRSIRVRDGQVWRPVRPNQHQVALGLLIDDLRVEQALQLTAERLPRIGHAVEVARRLAALLRALVAELREKLAATHAVASGKAPAPGEGGDGDEEEAPPEE